MRVERRDEKKEKKRARDHDNDDDDGCDDDATTIRNRGDAIHKRERARERKDTLNFYGRS